MQRTFKDYPFWVKIPLAPIVAVVYVVKLAWVILSALMALAGTLTGQPARLVMIFVYYVFFYALQGWNEGRDMVLRGHRIAEARRSKEEN